ncbi:hypothetical protein [Pseudonocardia sp. WMMC193]|uniref:hypothetical protein n=1 Tax=Pseudonocardia sp. WMMC193 TaxID=2911965 RepID=UPI001F194914|nr:hypothetical protein [Pseudonocardia sp. WMMC193]MCF7548119.1 hypothetical protein [Pseudonocardia sp. WMMC193]
MHLTSSDRDRLRGLFPDAVATRSELLALGLSASAITRSCRAGGPWRSPLRGIVVLADTEPTPRQRARVALAHAGAAAVLTGGAALRIHGLRHPVADESQTVVLVPHKQHVTGRGFVQVVRTRRMPPLVHRDGLRLAPPARAVVDATALHRESDAVRGLFAAAVHQRLCTPDQLAEEVASRQRPYTALAREVTAEIAEGIRSAAEAWAKRVIERSGLPAPLWNVALESANGRPIGVVDAWWEDVGLAWEIDSRAWHMSPEEHDRDTRKQSALAAEGIPVVRTRPYRLRQEPEAVLAELASAHRNAARHTRTPVRATLWRPPARQA